MTVEEMQDKIDSLKCENRMLRKMQPVTLEGDAATSFVLAAELSEADTKIKELQEEIAEYQRIEDIRRNREHTSHWIEYWRKKTGANNLTYPDWDAIFDDWKRLKDELELYKKPHGQAVRVFNDPFTGKMFTTCTEVVNEEIQ